MVEACNGVCEIIELMNPVSRMTLATHLYEKALQKDNP
jgi:hypothetical protein